MSHEADVEAAAQRGGADITQPHAPTKHRISLTLEVEVPAGAEATSWLLHEAKKRIHEAVKQGQTLVLEGKSGDSPTIS